jgi:hypothetical protein
MISCLTIILFISSIAPLCNGNIISGTSTEQKTFSIVQISDTQHLSYSYPESWKSLVNWIIMNQSTYNIKMVIHTGDIVDNGYGIPNQWITANSSMGMLLDSGIPYTWDAGNHDQNMSNGNYASNPDGDWYGSQYLAFNSTYMSSKPYWVSDINYGKNTAVQFSHEGYNFMVINLEFHANKTAIDWLINLINTHLNYNIIVATHSLLNGLQGYGYPFSVDSPQWEVQLLSILDSYPQVFLTMSGHYIHTKYPAGDEETSNYTLQGNREDTFFNRQMALGDLGKGANSIRLFTFDMENQRVDVSTYDVESNLWKRDSWNEFSFNLKLNGPSVLTQTQPLDTSASSNKPTITPMKPQPTTLNQIPADKNNLSSNEKNFTLASDNSTIVSIEQKPLSLEQSWFFFFINGVVWWYSQVIKPLNYL